MCTCSLRLHIGSLLSFCVRGKVIILIAFVIGEPYVLLNADNAPCENTPTWMARLIFLMPQSYDHACREKGLSEVPLSLIKVYFSSFLDTGDLGQSQHGAGTSLGIMRNKSRTHPHICSHMTFFDALGGKRVSHANRERAYLDSCSGRNDRYSVSSRQDIMGLSVLCPAGVKKKLH